MAMLKKINRVLSMLLLLMALALLYSKMFKAYQPENHSERPRNKEAPNRTVDDESESGIPVVICAAEERLGAAMATINSVYSNTKSSVIFYIVTLRDAIKLTRQYIKKTKLKQINYKILEFNPMVLKGKVKPDSSRPDLLHPLNFVRFYLPLLAISNHKKIVYLDDDIIVQGDIQNLYSIRLQSGHAAAFASDCDLPATHEMVRSVGMQTSYMGFLDYRKQAVRDLGINPNDCSFNPGVFVADIDEWRKQKITVQLEKWMSENFKENLYSSAMAGGVATPPMLIVFHNKYTTIDPKWHVRHMGWSPNAYYPQSVLQEAQLLHWNGRFKPWDYPCVHTDLWEKWFIPDPSGKFVLVRPET
ncbi:glycosyltransferase 8 domain-containing protein 2 isoform 2-T3 [Clarias gariepinus]|uniref:glycosyltransferase 8 domain-containing protein 2 isoform X2 n=1 Tax=Clarias gariepinus TaxID=13013 RepID=UPI00234C98EC|nr:glycosyltransferase 8 domain-containing protein 2 isoform X2 [Clarias gariepinus]